MKMLKRSLATASLIVVNFLSIPLAWSSGSVTDYYALLGVARDASDIDIKKAYRLFAMKYHPDRLHGASPEMKEQSETVFKNIKAAYEVLSNPQSRASYDSQTSTGQNERPSGVNQKNVRTIEELQTLLAQISRQSQEHDILATLGELSKFGILIHDDGAAEKLFNSKIVELIRKYKFGSLKLTKAFIEMTESWSYSAYLYAAGPQDWTYLHDLCFEQLILHGTDLRSIVELIGGARTIADMGRTHRMFDEIDDLAHSLDQQDTSHLRQGGRDPLPGIMMTNYQSGEGAAPAILKALFKSGQIATIEQFREAATSLKSLSKHLDLKDGLYRALSDHMLYAFPLIDQMTYKDLADLTVMSGSNPVEVLGLLQKFLETQKKIPRLTGEQLTSLITQLAEKSLTGPEYARIEFNGSLEEMSRYLAAHGGYTSESLQKIVQAQAAKYERHGYISPPTVFETARSFLYTTLREDILDLLVQNKAVLNEAGVHTADWEKIAKSLNFGSIRFKMRLSTSFLKTSSDIDWISEMQMKKHEVRTNALPQLSAPTRLQISKGQQKEVSCRAAHN